jgi:SAM-dependent methyltransferase
MDPAVLHLARQIPPVKQVTPLTARTDVINLGVIEVTDFGTFDSKTTLERYRSHEDRFRLVSEATNEKPAAAQIIQSLVINTSQALSPAMLDLGCGDGALTRLLAPNFEQILGVDRHASRLNKAQESSITVNASWIEKDIDNFGLEDSNISPSLTLMSHVLYYFREDQGAQARILNREYSRLAPGGSLVLIHSGLTGVREDIHNIGIANSFPFRPFLEQQAALYESIFAAENFHAVSFETRIEATKELAKELLTFFAAPIESISDEVIEEVLGRYENEKGTYVLPYSQVAFIVTKPWHA